MIITIPPLVSALNSEKAQHPRDILTQLGPRLMVGISHPREVAEKAGLIKIPVLQVNALIDTGAYRTTVSPRVAAELKLLRTGSAQVTSVHNTEDRPTYAAVVHFHWGRSKEIEVLSCDIQGIDCLIGRDVLQHWHMTYNGSNGTITICD